MSSLCDVIIVLGAAVWPTGQPSPALCRAQVGSGERSEKVRTYNYPQGRVTDHRIKLTAHNLESILEGDLSEFTDALSADERRRKLEAQAA